MFWSGSIASIPTGWTLANGSLGTPDLRDQFLIAAALDDSGVARAVIDGALAQSGGSPSHEHFYPIGPGYQGSPPPGDFNRFLQVSHTYPVCWAIPAICASQGALMESGIIAMWKGSIASIPPGWFFCDGTNGTPDLRNQFVIAASEDDAGDATAIISGVRQVFGGDPDHFHTNIPGSRMLDVDPAGDTSTTLSTESNYPPCYALAYIMKA